MIMRMNTAFPMPLIRIVIVTGDIERNFQPDLLQSPLSRRTFRASRRLDEYDFDRVCIIFPDSYDAIGE